MPRRLGSALFISIALSGPALAADLTITHVALIDGTGRGVQTDMTVVVEKDRFASILPTRLAPTPRGRVIDGRGRYLIPGLMDIHIHLKAARRPAPDQPPAPDRAMGEAALASFLYAGVTTVLDVGNAPDAILPLRADERAGKILAPHVFATGNLVTYPGSHGWEMGVTVTRWPEDRPKLEAQLAGQKPDVQKITYDDEGWGARPLIPIMPEDLLRKVVEFYNDHGVRTTVHVSNESRAREAVFAGVDSLAHTPIQGPVTEAFVNLAAAKKLPMATTLTIGDNYGRVHDHPEYLDQPLYRATVSAEERDALKRLAAARGETALSTGFPAYRPRTTAAMQRTWRQWMQTQKPVVEDNLRRIDAAGGVVAAGTDLSNGADTQRELELLSEAGIPNLEIIRIATLNGAKLLGREADMGSVEVGKIADAVLLDADPTKDINNVKAIALVMKAGEIIDESRLPLAGGAQKRRWPTAGGASAAP